MAEDNLLIEVAKAKVIARVKTEDGKLYEIAAPSFEMLKEFEQVARDGESDSDALLKQFAKLGLPAEVGKKLPITVINQIAKRIKGDDLPKK